MKKHLDFIRTVAAITVIVGIALILIGALTGPSFFTIVLGAAFLIAAYVAYQSGTSRVRELEEKKKNKK